MFNYERISPGEISLMRGDLVRLKTKLADWSVVKNERTHEKGRVPNNYIAVKDSPESFEFSDEIYIQMFKT